MVAVLCPPAEGTAKSDLGDELGSCVAAVHLSSFCRVSLEKATSACIFTFRSDQGSNSTRVHVSQRDKTRDVMGWMAGSLGAGDAEAFANAGGEEGQARCGRAS